MKRKSFLLFFTVVVFVSLLSVAVWASSENLGVFEESAQLDEGSVSDTAEEIEEDDITNKAVSAETKAESSLNSQDAAVQAEINKYNSFAKNFGYSKQEIFAGKKQDLTFSRVGYLEDDKADKVTYENGAGDEFVYNSSTGKLFFAQMTSLVTEKNGSSIGMSEAEKVAYKYAAENCEISEYKLSYSDEYSRGYAFVYSRYISGIRTADSFEATIGFDGEIVLVRNNTDILSDKDVVINQDEINNKINAELKKHENSVLEDTWIDVYNEKVVVNCKISYNDNGSTVSAVAVIPIE